LKTSSIIGDITQQKVDAVVNAANRELAGGAPATGGNVDMGRGRSLNGVKFRPEDGNHPDLNPTVEGDIP